MSLPLTRYDPTNFDGLPTARAENTHINGRTQPEDTVVTLPVVCDSYTNAPFPRPFIPAYKFLGNIQKDQANVLNTSPHPILALVIHGGGQHYVAVSGPKAMSDITELFSEKLIFSGNEGRKPVVEIHTPEGVSMDEKNYFGQPYTFFAVMKENMELLYPFLKWQGVFALSPTLSFSVYNLKNDQQPWTIMSLMGIPGSVIDNVAAKQQVLMAIKVDLWGNRNFCFFVADEVTASSCWDISGDMVAHVKAVTDTLDIAYVDIEDANMRTIILSYLIFGKPLSNEYKVYKQWLSYFTGPKEVLKFYRYGLYRLNMSRSILDCKLCKDTTHCKHDCPLPTVSGWQGLTPSDLQREDLAVRPHVMPTAAPSAQAEEIWKNVPKKGKGQDSGSRPRGGGRGGLAARGKSGSSSRGTGHR